MKINENNSDDDDNDDGLDEGTTDVSILHYFAGNRTER